MSDARRLDRTRRPEPGPTPRIALPRYERFQLENGLRVLAVRHDDVPEVSARIVFPAGAVEDDPGLAGTALLTARALTEGTKQRSAKQVAEELDYLGARFSVDVSHDATLLRLHFLSRVADEALVLLAEIVAGPRFEPKEVERLREERLDEIASGLDEPRVVANLRWAEAAFGDHPYGVRAGGVEETVRAIDAAVLREFHHRHYRPRGATLTVVGDLPDSAGLMGRLESAFGAWEGAAAEPRDLAHPGPLASRRLWAVPWDGPQTELRVGGLGIERRDSDYPAVMVMNAILGGLFSSRINMNLREEKGWTYGAASRFDARKRRGPYYVATAVDARASVAALREILSELERMRNDPPRADELELARNSLTLSLPRLFETADQVSGRVAQQIIYGLPDDYWERYADQIRAVGVADVERVAERLLSGDRVAAVVVGPVKELAAELESLGRVELRDIHGRPGGP